MTTARVLVKYIPVHKEEVKHSTSAHIILVQTNDMIISNFLCSPKGILVNITNNFHTRQVKKIKSNSTSKNNQQGSELPMLWNLVQNHVYYVPWDGLVSLSPHLCLWRWRGCSKWPSWSVIALNFPLLFYLAKRLYLVRTINSVWVSHTKNMTLRTTFLFRNVHWVYQEMILK